MLFSVGALCMIQAPLMAQDALMQGVAWAAPEDIGSAAADLGAKRRMGVEAVRTHLVRDERLLAVADSLGLSLFQELPLAGLPALSLLDTLTHARQLLDATLERAQPCVGAPLWVGAQ